MNLRGSKNCKSNLEGLAEEAIKPLNAQEFIGNLKLWDQRLWESIEIWINMIKAKKSRIYSNLHRCHQIISESIAILKHTTSEPIKIQKRDK